VHKSGHPYVKIPIGRQISWIQDTMDPDKVPMAFGIKITPHHHTPFTIHRDWHGFISVSLIAGLICIERLSYGKYPMPISSN